MRAAIFILPCLSLKGFRDTGPKHMFLWRLSHKTRYIMVFTQNSNMAVHEARFYDVDLCYSLLEIGFVRAYVWLFVCADMLVYGDVFGQHLLIETWYHTVKTVSKTALIFIKLC